ncbi:hypothetical protein HPB50_001491 [Hyalomma asiaticum]|uniref:Uncharacterized protein n=1 Tax=Hyalomma asiaticum TaxID=266040 RepID=A0ACB7RS16_HYAAI|nr:hypothetical protein HPB50_001491 [Hyalomma asiaticum]
MIRFSYRGHPIIRDSDLKVSVVAMIFCIVFMSVLALIVFVIAGLGGADEEDGEDAVNSTSENATSGIVVPNIHRAGGPVDPVPPPVPVAVPVEHPPKVTHAPEPSIPVLPATSEPSVKEIVCTVSHSGVTMSVYPPDRYCDYLYYCEVVLLNRELYGAVDDVSWARFKRNARTYRRVQTGVAFDHRYITARKVDGARAAIASLIRQNIKHLGLLNVVATSGELAAIVTSLKSVFERFKVIQTNSVDKKTMIAIGLYDYREVGAWTMYKKVIKEVVDTYKADTVIVITSAVPMKSEADCYAFPPTDLYSAHPKMNHSELVDPSYPYENAEAVVGLSLELGSLLYVLRKDAQDEQKIPYAACVDAGMTSQDVICQQGKYVLISRDGNLVAVAGYASTQSRKSIFLSETPSTLRDKDVVPSLLTLYTLKLTIDTGHVVVATVVIANDTFRSGGDKKIVVSVGLCLLLLGVIAAVVFLTHKTDTADVEEQEKGASEGGSDSGSGPFSPPAYSKPPATTTAKKTSICEFIRRCQSSLENFLHTLSVASTIVVVAWSEMLGDTRKEVICTVGDNAVVSIMYPPDAMCDYLYYTDVLIIDNKIRAVTVEASWFAFKEHVPRYRKTKAGISFDHRATPRAFVRFAARAESSEETRASLSPRFPPCARKAANVSDTEPSDESYVAPSGQ